MNFFHRPSLFSSPQGAKGRLVRGVPFGDSEESVRLESLLLRELLRQTPEWVYFKDVNGRFLRVSQTMLPTIDTNTSWGADTETQHKYRKERIISPAEVTSVEDLIGLSDQEYIPLEAERTRAEEKKIMESGEPVIDLIEDAAKSPSYRVWVSTSKSPIYDGNGKLLGIFGITRDITNRLKTEQALKRYSERLRGIVSLQEELMQTERSREAILDLACKRVNKLFATRGAAIVLWRGGQEYICSSLSGPNILETNGSLNLEWQKALKSMHDSVTVLELDKANFPHLFNLGIHSLLGATIYSGEKREGLLLIHSNEDKLFGEEDIRAFGVCSLVLSATLSAVSEWEARHAEVEALARFRTIFETSPIAIMKGDLEGKIQAANPAAVNLLGYSTEELTNMRFAELLLQAEDRKIDHDLFVELLAGKSTSYQLESQFKRSDGKIIWGQVTTALERDGKGNPISPIAMFEDVTERREAAEHLLQSQKTEAIGQLTAGIAHDFNNLLMGVLGFIELGAIEIDNPILAREYLSEATKSGRRAAELVKQLLSFGRRQNLQPCEVNLNGLLQDTGVLLRRLIDASIDIKFDLNKNLPKIYADPTQLRQIVVNLALNARDAMPEGGVITIRSRQITTNSSSRWKNLDLASDSYVVFSVADCGCGIEKSIQERIFEPFFTTKEVGEGSGLGLSSVYGILHQMGGGIEVASEIGKGSTFNVYLPMTPAKKKADSEIKNKVSPKVVSK